jgi:hypothetical protein
MPSGCRLRAQHSRLAEAVLLLDHVGGSDAPRLMRDCAGCFVDYPNQRYTHAPEISMRIHSPIKRNVMFDDIMVRLNNSWVKMTGLLARYEAGSQVCLRITNFRSLRQVAAYAI